MVRGIPPLGSIPHGRRAKYERIQHRPRLNVVDSNPRVQANRDWFQKALVAKRDYWEQELSSISEEFGKIPPRLRELAASLKIEILD